MSSIVEASTDIRLTHLTVVKITGSDAERFLQGQLTNDVSKLDACWQWNGYCNPKGRLLATLLLWRDEAVFFMLLDTTIAEATVKRLSMYVMRSDVQLEMMPNARCIGELTPAKPTFPQHSLKKLNADDTRLWLDGRCIRVALDASQSGLGEDATDWKAPPDWLVRDIEQGLPRVNSLTVEQFIPQMLNFDVLSGISFKKGCYTGQEIVARMHYLGKLKQRMYVCTLTNQSQTVLAGFKIVSHADGHSAGTIVNAVDGRPACLAVLRLDVLEAATNTPVFHVLGENEVVVATLAVNATQPYSVPVAKQSS